MTAVVTPDNAVQIGPTGTVFPVVERDVTDTCMQVCCIVTCPLHFLALVPGVLGKKTLRMEAEEAVLSYDCLCCDGNTRRPYGELGSVDVSHCGPCIGFSSNLAKDFPIYPGNCCETALVNEIVDELKNRMKQRGDTGQIKRTEAMAEHVLAIETKIDAIMAHMNIPIPTMPVAVQQESMKR